MEYFYAQTDEATSGFVTIAGGEAHHLVRVMRKSSGDVVYASAGTGTMYRVAIEEISRDSVRCRILERMERYNELPRAVILVQGILKNPGKMDFIVEKATELGVTRIVPVQSRYTVARGGKPDRWRALALAAMKQCGRCRLPEIDDVTDIQTAFSSLRGLHIVCDEQEDTPVTLESLLDPGTGTPGPVIITVGPEGGFSDDERAMFRSGGAGFASLGARRLRAETAAVAALARTAASVEQFHHLKGDRHVV